MASSRFVLGVILSGSFHVFAFVHMSHAKANVAVRPAPVVIEVDTSTPPPPPPPLEEPKPEPPPVNPAPSEPPMSAKSDKPPSATPPPAAAQAGKVLAAADDAPDVADFTMVQGNGTYAGGHTTATGTSKTAVTAQPRAIAATAPQANGGGGDGAGTGGPDRSRPARPVGSDWDCSTMFPTSATVDSATVVIVARVRPDGTPESITIVNDPNQGFGPAARACALRQRYAPAEDREGRAIAASTAPFRVRFTR